MLKLALAGGAALALMSNTETPLPTTTQSIAIPSPYRGSFEVVPKLECAGGRGSGVRISDDIVITAAHVATNGPCGIDGVPIGVAYHQPNRDFTAMRANLGPGLRAIYSCEGINAGQSYLAFGYANGGKANIEPLIGTNRKIEGGQTVMRGKVYGGMSGGALFTTEGVVVAIITMRHLEKDWGYVLPLSETYLCKS